jgi:hypothetical protein
MSEKNVDAAFVDAALTYREEHWDELAVGATMPNCPPWCVDCEDLSDDIPGSRFHNGAASPRIRASVDVSGRENYVLVRSSFCDLYPPLRVPVVSDDSGCIELCLGEERMTARMTSADARRLAQEILRRVDEIDHSPETRPPYD